ncbi:MAG TPA: TIGR03564 family F420-dependent LLM class oxidoreductase [Pseudomonadales bacterium]|nr:TIGR03564 family F420-dependent LLM class oxidoreductase [Pseudomonadales bacterium]
MHLGINGTGLVQRASVDAIVEHAQQAANDGFAHYWLAEHPTGGLDALTVLTAVGLKVPGIELGTAIIPTFPRHPMVLAGQAQTVRTVIGNRLTLGIGLSHASMMAQLGIGFDKPIRHLREYLSILVPLLNKGQVSFKGETLSCDAKAFLTPADHFPVVVAALGPQALAVAGRLADGTTLAWVGPRTVKEHIVPRISEAAATAGRPAPRIIATLPVCVTANEQDVRQRISQTLAMYSQLPSYKAMFEREGVATPGDLAIVGSEAKVTESIGQMAEAGVTDFAASEFTTNSQERERTRALLKQMAAHS